MKPVEDLFHEKFYNNKEDCHEYIENLGYKKLITVYSLEQIQNLFDKIKEKKFAPFRHTIVVDYDEIVELFNKLEINTK